MSNQPEAIQLPEKSQPNLVRSIRHLMQQNNAISETELSRKTGIPKTTIYKILSGETTDPRSSTLIQIAHFFGVSLDTLLGLSPISLDTCKIPSRSIPVLSWEDAIKGDDLLSGLNPNNWDRWATIDKEIPMAFSLISRPSLRPCFPSGTLLVIDPNIQPQDGDYVLVHYPDTNEATLREISIDGRQIRLMTLATSEFHDYEENIKILGVLIQSKFAHRDNIL